MLGVLVLCVWGLLVYFVACFLTLGVVCYLFSEGGYVVLLGGRVSLGWVGYLYQFSLFYLAAYCSLACCYLTVIAVADRVTVLGLVRLCAGSAFASVNRLCARLVPGVRYLVLSALLCVSSY